MNDNIYGKYNSIQTLGTVDGPGVRFVLFMQGCPLHCGYCHNPETREINNAGITANVPQIMEKVLRCRAYFGEKGGITVSGGEPLLQAKFVTELFRACHKENINTCLDTSGCLMNNYTEELLRETDLVLLDIKMTSDEQYKNYIGCSLAKPVEFLGMLNSLKVPTWIRQVIVCGVNDDDRNIKRLAHIASSNECVKRVELLPFKKLCVTKYREMGIPFPFDCYDATSDEVINRLTATLEQAKSNRI